MSAFQAVRRRFDPDRPLHFLGETKMKKIIALTAAGLLAACSAQEPAEVVDAAANEAALTGGGAAEPAENVKEK